MKNPLLLFLTAILTTVTLSQFQLEDMSAMPLKTSEPLCFFQTKTGIVVDLTPMCGYRSPTICTIGVYSEYVGVESQAEEESAKSNILTSFCKRNEKCVLTDTCDRTPDPKYIPNVDKPQG